MKNYGVTESLKYLRIYFDENLNYQDDVKNIMNTMECGIKTKNLIRDPTPKRIIILHFYAVLK